jgi:hypothetical protein
LSETTCERRRNQIKLVILLGPDKLPCGLWDWELLSKPPMCGWKHKTTKALSEENKTCHSHHASQHDNPNKRHPTSRYVKITPKWTQFSWINWIIIWWTRFTRQLFKNKKKILRPYLICGMSISLKNEIVITRNKKE